ncbi:MAG: ABC transporter transmembrane domain-containing protein [Pseudomonadales bacterium]
MAAEKNKDLSTLLALVQFVLPYKKQLAGAIAALIFTAMITLSIGQGVRMLIDQGFVEQSVTQLNQAIMFILLLSALMAAGSFVRFYLVSWLGERVSADIRKAVFEHIISLHPSYFETNLSGEIMSRLTTDTTLLQTIIGSSFSMALRSSLTLVGAFVLLLISNIKLTMIVVGAVPLLLGPLLLYGRRVRALSRKSQDSIADVGSYAGEAIQQIKTVQSYTQENTEIAAFGNEVEKAFDIARRRIKQRAVLIVAVIVLVFGALAGMLWVGGNDVLTGKMSGGELGAFIFYAIMMATSVATLSEVYGELQRAAGATDRLLELMRVPNAITAPENNRQAGAVLDASASFDNVTFCYPSRPSQPALQDFSLYIEQAKSLALVGPSGAGKSTVFELLLRFYDPQSGGIMLGDVDLRQLDPQELRAQMALVAQQPALFSADVAYNIRYGKPGASDAELIAATKAAHAHEFIMQLPDGYGSFLGEQGVRLSGGQRQRIAIARAILKNPRILLLDEATSALDAESENQVQLALQELMRQRTTVIIAHRLATVLHVDQIAVLDQGQLVAQGTHAQLLSSSPLYKRLASLQFRDEPTAA